MALENIPQISQPTEINILEIFNSHLPSMEQKEENKENEIKPLSS